MHMSPPVAAGPVAFLQYPELQRGSAHAWEGVDFTLESTGTGPSQDQGPFY